MEHEKNDDKRRPVLIVKLTSTEVDLDKLLLIKSSMQQLDSQDHSTKKLASPFQKGL